MCGIGGVFSYLHQNQPARANLECMNHELYHRGPDSAGVKVFDRAGLVFRRLAIIDLSPNGDQPMANEDETVWIVFNGEIYNYLEIKPELEKKGHVFRSRSDTEVVLHLYEEYGSDCVTRLRGMFAFAIWDARQRRLMLARDRLGIKPLYYIDVDGELIFASEIKSLLAYKDFHREIDPAALLAYFALRYVPVPLTMLKNVKKLMPGEVLLHDGLHASVQPYWDLASAFTDTPAPLTDQQWQDEFVECFENTVESHLISDVPMGVLLSGGLDSSAVTAAMSKVSAGTLRTFSVGFDLGAEYNELAYARTVASHFHTEHHEQLISPAEFNDLSPRLVWSMDEPVADPAAIPLYFVSRMASSQVKVVMSGEGADELLSGYSAYQYMLWMQAYGRIPTFLRQELLTPLLISLTHSKAAATYLPSAGQPLSDRYLGLSYLGLEYGSLLKNGSIKGEKQLKDGFAGLYQAVAGLHPINQMAYVDLKTWLVDDLLVKADRMSMANSLELRVPFLDYRLVEFAGKLPVHLKRNRGKGKHILREAMRNHLPEAVLTRPKMGFPVPIKIWLANGSLQPFLDMVLSHDSAAYRYLNPGRIRTMLDQHKLGKQNYGVEIWKIIVFELWVRMFVDGHRLFS